MDGKIYLDTLKEVAEFLVNFTGSTSKFQVQKVNGQYVIEFTGGY